VSVAYRENNQHGRLVAKYAGAAILTLRTHLSGHAQRVPTQGWWAFMSLSCRDTLRVSALTARCTSTLNPIHAIEAHLPALLTLPALFSPAHLLSAVPYPA
jgi:hypothetical protein